MNRKHQSALLTAWLADSKQGGQQNGRDRNVDSMYDTGRSDVRGVCRVRNLRLSRRNAGRVKSGAGSRDCMTGAVKRLMKTTESTMTALQDVLIAGVWIRCRMTDRSR